MKQPVEQKSLLAAWRELEFFVEQAPKFGDQTHGDIGL
jgi:hypothetical protein